MTTTHRRPARLTLHALLLALAAILGGAAHAQTAPDGNAHPDVEVAGDPTAANPFGEPVIAPPPTDPDAIRLATEAKVAFADRVDLGPLRDLAVNHGGRVKILDTLAREVVDNLAGRPTYVDYIKRGDPDRPDVEDVAHDPLFTLLDLIIDPAYYLDKPLIHVEFLPLRIALLEAAIPDDDATRERWKKVTRLSPLMLHLALPEVEAGLASPSSAAVLGPSISEYSRGIARASNALNVFQGAVGTLLVIPPDSVEDVWHRIPELAPGHPVRTHAAAIGAAWRAGDADAVNAAVRELARLIPLENPALYPSDGPTGRRTLELAYNAARPFDWGAWLYLVALVALVLAFGTGWRWLTVAGVGVLCVGVAVHAAGFTLRCIIAERFAIQNQYESMTGVSLFAAVVGVAFMAATRRVLFGAASAGAGFLVLLAATRWPIIPGDGVEREAAILNTSVLLKYHVTTVLTSYGLITLGLIASLFYLATFYGRRLLVPTPALAAGPAATAGGPAPADEPSLTDDQTRFRRTLRELDIAQLTILQLAFWTLGVGIVLGAWWADHSWGRWWAFDPKETWALITWIVYLIVIHVRMTLQGSSRELVTAWLSVAGFLVMLWTYFGVNLLLPGLHAYA